METLTGKEAQVLNVIKECATTSDNGKEFIIEDVAKKINLSELQVRGVCSSLQKKGLVNMFNGACYYDGEIIIINEQNEEDPMNNKKNKVMLKYRLFISVTDDNKRVSKLPFCCSTLRDCEYYINKYRIFNVFEIEILLFNSRILYYLPQRRINAYTKYSLYLTKKQFYKIKKNK